ncbi:MAG TPA: hypothetical protein DDW84_03985 [Phycisphaerales bacterium]|nr:hypothetical protein [Phycisphaerales bacterium]HBR19878.1 hypothetical protein [Phycisphaerales bacterium]
MRCHTASLPAWLIIFYKTKLLSHRQVGRFFLYPYPKFRFINTIIDFLIIAFTIFLVIKVMNKFLKAKQKPAA